MALVNEKGIGNSYDAMSWRKEGRSCNTLAMKDLGGTFPAGSRETVIGEASPGSWKCEYEDGDVRVLTSSQLKKWLVASNSTTRAEAAGTED